MQSQQKPEEFFEQLGRFIPPSHSCNEQVFPQARDVTLGEVVLFYTRATSKEELSESCHPPTFPAARERKVSVQKGQGWRWSGSEWVDLGDTTVSTREIKTKKARED